MLQKNGRRSEFLGKFVLVMSCWMSFNEIGLKGINLYSTRPCSCLRLVRPNAHSWIGQYFFSYLLTCEVLEIMAQMWQYIFFFKPETNKGEFRLYFELFEKKL